MNLWEISFIGFGLATIAVFVCWCLCRALEAAYQARLELQRDLVSQLVARRWSLVPQAATWTVYGDKGPITQHARWEIAVQDALKNAKGAA